MKIGKLFSELVWATCVGAVFVGALTLWAGNATAKPLWGCPADTGACQPDLGNPCTAATLAAACGPVGSGCACATVTPGGVQNCSCQ